MEGKKKRGEERRSVERMAQLGRWEGIEKPGRWGGKITGKGEWQNVLPNKGTGDNLAPLWMCRLTHKVTLLDTISDTGSFSGLKFIFWVYLVG